MQQLLLRSGHSPEGKRVVVCGRSNLVGKPLAVLLMQKREGANATVTVCHTRHARPRIDHPPGRHPRRRDGRPQAQSAPDMVREGAVVIDVGTNAVPTRRRRADRASSATSISRPCAEKAAAITPVPGGVGPMTRAMLLWNTVLAAEGGPPDRT